MLKIVQGAGRIRQATAQPLSASAALLVSGWLKFHDLVLLAGIRVPLLFYDDLKLKSFEGEFIRQALKERALFGIGRRLTHKSKVSGVRTEPLQSSPEVLHRLGSGSKLILDANSNLAFRDDG